MRTIRYAWLWRTPVGIAVMLSTAGIFAYTFCALPGVTNPQTESLVSSGGIALLNLLLAIFSFQLALQKQNDPRLRRAWLLLGIAACSNVIAEILWYYYESILGIEPFPSLADLFYLLYYPLTLIGVLLFPFVRVSRRERLVLWLDLSIVMLSSAMVFWYFILAPMQAVHSTSGFAGIIAIAYPIGDLLIFTGLISLIQRDIEHVARWTLLLLAGGMLFLTFADTLFGYFEVTGETYLLAPLNVLWLASALSHLGAAASQLKSSQQTLSDLPSSVNRTWQRFRQALPYLGAVIGPILLVAVINSTLLTGPRLRGLLFGTLGLIGLVLLRQYTVLRENLDLVREMEYLAITDSLTGTYNRHYFNQTLMREIERAHRYNNPLSVLLMDVDDFKMFNDHYGHLQGDVVLKTISNSLATQLRSSDVLARFGGDEFVVILPETDEMQAQLVAKKMARSAAACKYADFQLGVSVGVATYQGNISAEGLLEIADRALYEQKAARKKNLPPSIKQSEESIPSL
jgi:diguanylate cyclase (GGDEF)-like protein